jgi:hypothetical protein
VQRICAGVAVARAAVPGPVALDLVRWPYRYSRPVAFSACSRVGPKPGADAGAGHEGWHLVDEDETRARLRKTWDDAFDSDLLGRFLLKFGVQPEDVLT